MKNYRLEALDTYQLSMQLADDIWNLVLKWNYLALDTMGKQIIRSADSIAATISEGYGRYYFKDNKRFCYYSWGSILETKTWLNKANQRKLIPDKLYQEYINRLESIHKKLNAYMKYIGKIESDSTESSPALTDEPLKPTDQ